MCIRDSCYTCSVCDKIFHSKCIPKNHKVYMPEDLEDDDLFVYHSCFKIQSASDDEAFPSIVQI